MATKYVLFIITSAETIGPNNRKTGYFFPEVAHPFEEFDRAGYAVDFATINGGAPPADGYDESDASSKAFHASKAFQRMQNSRKLSEIEVTAYDAVFVPGGLGPMVDMSENPEVKTALAAAYEAGLIVGAVCHGPAALLGTRLSTGEMLVKGKSVTGFTNAEEESYAADDVPFLLQSALEEQGAKFVQGDLWQPNAVVDGRLVTGQNPASAAPMAQKMIGLMA
ncbi:MAG: type 1 glutamine amidotransferase domain-containing protein [Myxococcota bacterium]